MNKKNLTDLLSANLIYIKLGVVAIVVVLAWLHFKPQQKPVGEAATAQSAPQLAHVATEQIKPPGVTVYKPEAKKKLNLPASIQGNPAQHVVASSRINANLNPQTVTTVIDDKTGETITLVTREPLPWLAAEQTGEARIDYGWKGGRNITRLSLTEDMFQIKALHAGLQASLDSDGQYFVGAGIGWKW